MCDIVSMLNKEVKQFIQDNGLVRIQASPMTETFDLWECAGGHVWTWDMIVEAVKNNWNKFDFYLKLV